MKVKQPMMLSICVLAFTTASGTCADDVSMSKIHPSTATGTPESIVHDGASAMQFLRDMEGDWSVTPLPVESNEPGVIRFEFTGGANLNPDYDSHILSSTYRIIDKDTIETDTVAMNEGKTNGGKSIMKRLPRATANSN